MRGAAGSCPRHPRRRAIRGRPTRCTTCPRRRSPASTAPRSRIGADTRPSASSRSQNFRWKAPTRGRMSRRSVARDRPNRTSRFMYRVWISGGTAPDRSSSTTAPVVAGSRHSSARRVRSVLRQAGLRELGEVGRRQRGHQHADVHEQAHVRVVHVRRSPRSPSAVVGESGRLLPLDLLVQHEVQVVQGGQESSQEGARRPGRSEAGRRRPPRGARHGAGGAGTRGAPPRRVAARAEPVVEAGPDDAHAAAGGFEIAAQRVDLGIRRRRGTIATADPARAR